jgi:hypothetical protein
LNTGKAWWTLAILIVLASVAKIVPVTLVSKLCSRKPWFYCLSIGVLMNTRGIVQLVVLNIGVQLGVISPILFAIFVLMATILTFLTSPILYVLYPKDYDIRKLSVPNVAPDLRDIREKRTSITECNNNDDKIIRTISKNDITPYGSIRNSFEASRRSSFNMLGHDTHIIRNASQDYTSIDLKFDRRQSTMIDSVKLQVPRQSITMTRF